MLLYPACACTKQVYLHLHLHLHCHLHITMCHHMWTMCEQCVNIHLPIVSLNAIVPCMSIYNLCLCTYTCTTLPLAYHHVWTMCEHYSVNIQLPIVSLNTLYPACPCTMQVYLHLHLLHCHLHITMCHHMWTLCEHASTNCFLKLIATCMSRDNVNVSVPVHAIYCYLHLNMSNMCECVHIHVVHCEFYMTMWLHVWRCEQCCPLCLCEDV